MEYRKVESLKDLEAVPVYIVSTAQDADDVNIADLWRVVARRKMLFFSCILAAVLLAVLYMYFKQPVYTAVAHLLPPRQQHIQELLVKYHDVDDLEADRYTPENVYSLFLNNLRSPGMRREFFKSKGLMKHYLPDAGEENVNVDRIFDERFDTNFQVLPDKQDPSLVMVAFSDGNPNRAAELLNGIIGYANERTIDQLVDDVSAGIAAQIVQVRYQLDSKLKLAEQRRLDTITNLKESLRIARALGIKNTSVFPKISEKTQAGLAVNTAQVPSYMRGSDALETEISVLESRKSDEPFVGGLRDLQERRALLEGISLDPSKLSAVTIDVSARTPYHRSDVSGRFMILLAMALFGAIVGIFLAFFVEHLSQVRRRTE